LIQSKSKLFKLPWQGGASTCQLVSAVASCGGIGSFGFAYSSPQDISTSLKETIPAGPVNANFFIFPPIQNEDLKGPIEDLYKVSRIRPPMVSPPFYPDLESQLEPVWKHRPAMVSFHFGIPVPKVILKAKELGILVAITATSVEEALVISDSGADVIVAQGIEAGGHRGTFLFEKQDEELKMLDLLSRIKSSVKTPAVGAGGVMTRKDLIRTLQTGAVAAQMGTAFITCAESGATSAHKRYMLNGSQRETVYTKSFSGRRAQGINNQFIKDMQGKSTAAFPVQNALTAAMRKNAVASDDGEYQALWAGSNYHLAKATTVDALMNTLKI